MTPTGVVTGAVAGAIALISCATLVPVMNAFCAWRGLFDSPGPLKIHIRPIPRLGGVAIAISLSLGFLLSGQIELAQAWPFFAALALIWLAGVVDDVRGLSPIFRLAAQIAGASILWSAGWRLPLMGNGAFSLVGICLFIITFVNAFNFVDGSDGVCAGIATIIAVTYILIGGVTQSSLSVIVAWALTGACLGFLKSNLPPANIFMGDCGSTTLGLVIAFLALNSFRMHGTETFGSYFALMPAGLPLIDAALAVVRRLRNKSSPLYGDRFHFYDLLIARGLSGRRVALACYVITAIFCFAEWLAGQLAAQNSYERALAISAVTVGGFLIIELRLGSLRFSETNQPKQPPPALRLPSSLFENSK